MLNRRQTLSLLALGSSAAATATTALLPCALHAHESGAAPAPQPADAAQPIPPFSSAAPGDAVPPGWTHQRLPKVERANAFAVVQDGARRVLQVRSNQSSSSWVSQLSVDVSQRVGHLPLPVQPRPLADVDAQLADPGRGRLI